MSLDILDLGLTDTVREIVGELNAGVVHIFKPTGESSPNPFDEESLLPELVVSAPLISFKYSSGEDRREFMADDRDIVSCKIATPQNPILLGQYAYLNFSRGTSVTVGTVAKIEPSLSTLFKLQIDTKPGVPWPWEKIQTFLETGIYTP